MSAIAAATTSSYWTRCGGCRGVAPFVCVQMYDAPKLGGDLEQAGIVAAPRVVEHVGSFGADRPADVRPPGVDADHQVGELGPDRGHERRGAADLLVDVDQVTRTGLHPADVDEVGAGRDGLANPFERGPLGEGGATVVEGVAGAVHDRHHQQRVVGERAVPQREHGQSSIRANGRAASTS